MQRMYLFSVIFSMQLEKVEKQLQFIRLKFEGNVLLNCMKGNTWFDLTVWKLTMFDTLILGRLVKIT